MIPNDPADCWPTCALGEKEAGGVCSCLRAIGRRTTPGAPYNLLAPCANCACVCVYDVRNKNRNANNGSPEWSGGVGAGVGRPLIG
uniref:Uncharacterized protein n=1 Tax=Anopheles dirus TaxID=7168 RepID=A0A182NW77_9DIPT